MKRPKDLWVAEANKHGADLARVQVWDVLSELFLDSYRNDAELQQLAEIIAESPFSTEELAHILDFEVAPVCAPNLLQWIGGEWAGFDPNWLIERCLQQQRQHPFPSSGCPKEPPLLARVLRLGQSREARLLLSRVQRIRDSQDII